MIILIIIILIMIFGGLGFITIKRIKQTDPNYVDKKNKDSSNTQDFMPFEEIKDSMISLGLHQYRAIIKCSSINYNLKTNNEKTMIEASYQRFLNSLSHPISIFIQTKNMDNSKMLNKLSVDIDNAVEQFPLLQEYGQSFYNDMTDIYTKIGNNKEKNKYIIVPYDVVDLSNLTDAEKYDYALSEMQSRCQIIIDNLQGLGINSQILKTDEVMGVIYTSNHKDNSSRIDEITSGEFLTMTVSGEDKLSKITDEGRLDWILYEAQLRLESEILYNKVINDNLKDRSMDTVSELGKIREALAGEYQYIFNINEKLNLFK